MKYLRLVGIAIFAICALTAAMATTANAAEPPALITYSGSGAFTITSGAGELETSGKLRVTCTGDNGTGQLGKNQATTAELTVTFTGCEIGGLKCKSAGLANGNIQTVKLAATLGRIKAGEAGILIKPKTGTAFLVPVLCGGEVEFTATGSVIGTLTPVDTQTNKLTAKFTQVGGLQTIKKFEGETTVNNLIAKIGSSGLEQAGLESVETLTLREGSGQLLA
jgi:hypothetical protein